MVWWRWVGADCMWVVDVVWGRLRVDVRPYSFVWVDCVWAVDIVWADCA